MRSGFKTEAKTRGASNATLLQEISFLLSHSRSNKRRRQGLKPHRGAALRAAGLAKLLNFVSVGQQKNRPD